MKLPSLASLITFILLTLFIISCTPSITSHGTNKATTGEISGSNFLVLK